LAKKCLIIKARRKQKYHVREYNRCQRCGRPRAYMRKYAICRICFRELSLMGEIPGITKASW
jgi:small subunit ribosomal protein S14